MGFFGLGKKAVMKEPAQELAEIEALTGSVIKFERRMEFIIAHMQEVNKKIGRVVMIQTKEHEFYMKSLAEAMVEYKHVAHAWGPKRDKMLVTASQLFAEGTKHAEEYAKSLDAMDEKKAEVHRQLMNKALNQLLDHNKLIIRMCTALKDREHDVISALQKADENLKASINLLQKGGAA